MKHYNTIVDVITPCSYSCCCNEGWLTCVNQLWSREFIPGYVFQFPGIREWNLIPGNGNSSRISRTYAHCHLHVTDSQVVFLLCGVKLLQLGSLYYFDPSLKFKITIWILVIDLFPATKSQKLITWIHMQC